MNYFLLLLVLCLAGFVLTGCGDAAEQYIEQTSELEEVVNQEDVDTDKEPEMAQLPDFVKPPRDWLAITAEEAKEFTLLFNERGIWPGDEFKFASSFAWVMNELESEFGIYELDMSPNNYYLAVASILREIEEALDDQFAYKEGRIFLEKNLIDPGDDLIPTIGKIISDIFIAPGDYLEPVEGGILNQYNVNPKDLFK
jgi:hypothetical protein